MCKYSSQQGSGVEEGDTNSGDFSNECNPLLRCPTKNKK